MKRLRLLQIPVVVGLFAVLLFRTDIGEMRDALRHVNPWLAAGVVALNGPIVLLFAARSHLVLRRMGHRVPADVLVPVMVLGNVVGSMTPASTGEVLRAAALRSHANVTARDGAALVLFERALSLYLMCLGTGAAVALLVLPLAGALAAVGAALFLLLLPAAAPALLGLIPEPRADAAGLAAEAARRLSRIAGQLRMLAADRLLLLTWSFATGLVFSLVSVQYWLVARSVADVIRPDQAWVGLGVSQLAGIASLMPLGLGAADGSLAAVLRRLGMTLEQGSAVAILVRATSTLPLLLLAGASYVYLARRAPGASATGEPALPVPRA